MEEINGKGLLAGIVTWLLIVVIASYQADCLRYNGCGRNDLILHAIICVGMLVPAWLVAVMVSSLTKEK